MRPNCISLDALRALGPDTITKLASALSIEAKAKAALESATAHVEQLFSEIALSGVPPVEVAPLAIDPNPIVLKPRPQDKSQEAVMPLQAPFLVAAPIPSVPAPAEEEATTEGVTPCPSVVVEPAPVVATSPPASGAVKSKKEEIWLPIREISARLGVKPQRLGPACRSWECKEDGSGFIYRLSEATEYARGKGWLDNAEEKPAYQPLDKPYFERLGLAHIEAIDQGQHEAEAQDWKVFYIVFNEQTGEVAYAARKGVIDETPGLVAVERWELSRGGIWDSQPLGKDLGGQMRAQLGAMIGARVLA
jgi:hypothetical protein